MTVFSIVVSVQAQAIYSKAFGNENNSPVIFMHGGPGGNSVQFEGTTAPKLADKGFYVIAYDQRGEGRSIDEKARLIYREAFEDLNSIYKKCQIKQANLIEFSFGGLIASFYTEKYPQNVGSLTLVSSLISQQESYDHILKTVKKI